VGQRINDGGVNSQQRIEEVGKAAPVSRGDETEKRSVTVETPGLPLSRDGQGGLAIAVEQFVAEPPRCVLVRHLDGDGTDPLDVDNGDESVRQDSRDGAATGDFV
jgi:hypothetical protein